MRLGRSHDFGVSRRLVYGDEDGDGVFSKSIKTSHVLCAFMVASTRTGSWQPRVVDAC